MRLAVGKGVHHSVNCAGVVADGRLMKAACSVGLQTWQIGKVMFNRSELS